MNKIDEILEHLQGVQPMIDDPDALTERIMYLLPDMNAHEIKRQSHKSMTRWWIAAAAVFIVIVAGVLNLLSSIDTPPQRPLEISVQTKPEKHQAIRPASPVTQERAVVATNQEPLHHKRKRVSPQPQSTDTAVESASSEQTVSTPIYEEERMIDAVREVQEIRKLGERVEAMIHKQIASEIHSY